MVDLENTTRPSPSAARVRIGHFVVCAPAPWRVVARVKGDGALEEDWGRQLGGVSEGARLERKTRARGKTRVKGGSCTADLCVEAAR
jgi:hypothetical protein